MIQQVKELNELSDVCSSRHAHTTWYKGAAWADGQDTARLGNREVVDSVPSAGIIFSVPLPSPSIHRCQSQGTGSISNYWQGGKSRIFILQVMNCKDPTVAVKCRGKIQ